MSGEAPVIVVLISGRGSNLRAIHQAIVRGEIRGRIAGVITNNPDAEGLSYAQGAEIPTHVVDHRQFASRAAFDQALMQVIDQRAPDVVVLAGFMRILGEAFIRHYAGRLINIHPSLLPLYPGLNTHARALADGAREHGATVHFVSNDVDAGPPIIQARVPVHANDTAQGLAARVLEQEHRIFPLALKWFLEGRLTIDEGRVLLDGRLRTEQGLSGAKPT